MKSTAEPKTYDLIFEETTSPLYQSNDGRIYYDHSLGPIGTFVVVDGSTAEVVLETKERILVDAYIAGYDLATDVTNSSDLSPGGDPA